jgi:hypothetical protein
MKFHLFYSKEGMELVGFNELILSKSLLFAIGAYRINFQIMHPFTTLRVQIVNNSKCILLEFSY